MKKIIRLTESDLIKLVKKTINEQNVLDNLIYSRTNFVNLVKSKGWEYNPNHAAKSSAFVPSSKDLMIDGYTGKPLVFTNNSNYCYIERNGDIISCGDKFGGELKKFRISNDFENFKRFINTI